ncbi:MAG: hypothetical protein KDB26_07080 [Microthrixaceae bacterium]|nr:hypothetical protein [Microthrixaceae bacterium]
MDVADAISRRLNTRRISKDVDALAESFGLTPATLDTPRISVNGPHCDFLTARAS